MRRLIEFYEVYAEYRASHGRMYSARIAFGIAFKGSAF